VSTGSLILVHLSTHTLAVCVYGKPCISTPSCTHFCNIHGVQQAVPRYTFSGIHLSGIHETVAWARDDEYTYVGALFAPRALAAWLPAWLPGWLPGWLPAWLPAWLAGWLAGWLRSRGRRSRRLAARSHRCAHPAEDKVRGGKAWGWGEAGVSFKSQPQVALGRANRLLGT
jgi:hypothetical protein